MSQLTNLLNVIAIEDVAASPVAPTIVFKTALATAASGVTRTGDYGAIILLQYDTLWAVCFSRAAGTNTTTPPAGEGWGLFYSCRLAGFTFDIYWKRVGVGSTDPSRQTSVFTFSTGGNAIGTVIWAARGCVRTGNPYSQFSAVPGALNGASATPVSSVVALAVALGTLSLRLFATADDNSLNANSRGTLVFGGSSYNLQTALTGSLALVSEADVDSSVVTCTVTQSINAPKAYLAPTVVLNGDVPTVNPVSVVQLASAAAGESRINSTGWTEGYATDILPRGGFYYSAAYWVNHDRTFDIRLYSEPVGGGTRTLVDSYTSGVIADPVGITFWPGDAHFTPTVTFSISGKLEIFLLAHGNESPMQFGKATAIGSCQVTLVDWPWQADASYPEALQVGDGTALVCYRVGVAGGDGWQTLWEENPDESGWTQVATKLIYYSTHNQSPYMNRVTVDPVRSYVNLCWTWAARNESKGYHGVAFARAVRDAPLTWHGEDVAGNVVTWPVSELTPNVMIDDCTVTATIASLPFPVHNGGSFDPATGLPLIIYMKSAGPAVGDGTNLCAADWVSGAWSPTVITKIHPTWNFVNAPPNSERAVVRGPDRFIWKGMDTITYTSDIALGTSGVSCLMGLFKSGGVWSSSFILADLRFFGACPRFNMVDLITRGRLSYLLTEMCDDNDGVFLENVLGNIGIVDIS